MSIIAAVCPTYRREQRILENTLGLWVHQTLPKEKRILIIVEDDGQLQAYFDYKNRYLILSLKNRFLRMGRKYNFLIELANSVFEAEWICIWEDDDIYFPDHLERFYNLFESGVRHIRPKCIYVDKPDGGIRLEKRIIHANLGFTYELWKKADGYVENSDNAFDFVFMDRLVKKCQPWEKECNNPSYLFRWFTSGSYHGEVLDHPERWYSTAPKILMRQKYNLPLKPQLDEYTQKLFIKLGYNLTTQPSVNPNVATTLTR